MFWPCFPVVILLDWLQLHKPQVPINILPSISHLKFSCGSGFYSDKASRKAEWSTSGKTMLLQKIFNGCFKESANTLSDFLFFAAKTRAFYKTRGHHFNDLQDIIMYKYTREPSTLITLQSIFVLLLDIKWRSNIYNYIFCMCTVEVNSVSVQINVKIDYWYSPL